MAAASLFLIRRAFHATAPRLARRIAPVHPTEARPSPTAHLPAWLKDFKTGQPLGFVQLRQIIYGLPLRRDILQRVIVWQLAKRRSGNHKTKGRNEVRGSTKKMGPQKGSGGARHGTKRAPIYVKGGVAHGPVVRSHAFKLNKKVRALGLRVALSAKYAQADGLHIVDSSTLIPADPKTNTTYQVLKAHEWLDKRSLIITGKEMPQLLRLSTRNIPRVRTLPAQGLNVYDIVRAHRVILTKEAVEAIDKRFERVWSSAPRTMPERKPKRHEHTQLQAAAA